MIKRRISLLMAMTILISASACNDGVTKKTKADDFSMTNVPSYEEKEIGSAIGVQSPARRIGLDSKEQLVLIDNRETDSFCIITDANGTKLQEYKNDTANGVLFTLDAQDNRYVVDEKYSPEKEDDKNKEITYTLAIYNSKGEKQKSFDLGKRTFTEKQSGIIDIAVDTKGTVYLLLRRENIEVIGADGKKVKDIPAQKADYIEMDAEDHLLIGSFDGSNGHSFVEKRSVEKEVSLWTTELASINYIQKMKYSLKNKILYILTDKGILSCSSDGNIAGYVFDLKQSSLLESGIYINDFAFDSNKNIYILAFKSDSSSGTYKSAPLFYKYIPMKDGQKPKNQKTLTIRLKGSERSMEAAISKFQKKHPEIKVEVKDFLSEMVTSAESLDEAETSLAQNAENYQKVISTELMAGKGADIIEMRDLPYKKFVDKNVLVNMSKLIKNDKSFDLNKYHQGILNTCKYKDSLYIVPINFSFTPLMANKSIMNKEGLNIDSTKWTWKEFLSIAQKITKDKNGDGKPDQYALPKMSTEQIFRYIYAGEYPNFIDFDRKTANFDSKEFIEILNFVKDFSAKNVCSPTLDMLELSTSKVTDPGTIGFIQDYFISYPSINKAQSIFNGEVEFLDMPSYSGKRNPKSFLLGQTFSINNNSEMKTEAWEFIKWLLSDEIQSNPEMYFSAVNINAQKEKAKRELERNDRYKFYKDQGRNVKPLTQADVDLVDKMIGEFKTITYSDPQANKIVNEGAKEFFSGKKTAEEAAKQIQNKMNIYLGE